MHPRRQVAAPRTSVASLQANALASGKWRQLAVCLIVGTEATHLWTSLLGHYVHAGNILATQRHFRWHPGAHVGLGKNKCLYALEEGVVRYTKEVYVPSPSNSEAVDLVTRLPEGAVLYKTFVHVVPAKPEGTFKLVAML
nr:PREDICTED: 39S ribosomal protein L27, mitochondrial isoform X2 [Bos mutus]